MKNVETPRWVEIAQSGDKLSGSNSASIETFFLLPNSWNIFEKSRLSDLKYICYLVFASLNKKFQFIDT